VALQAERRHEVEVLAPAVVVVAGDVAGVAVLDDAGEAAEGVPDRVGAPVLVRRSLDLVGGGGGAETESRWEGGHRRQPIGAAWPPAARAGGSDFPHRSRRRLWPREGEPLLLTPTRGRRAV